jgi:hypothetical protein
MAESFFASLECELIARRSWKTKTEARLAVFTWIESWYNPRRRHSGLNYQSPNTFERKQQEKTINTENQIILELNEEAQTVRENGPTPTGEIRHVANSQACSL